MSAAGQKATSASDSAESALPPRTDIQRTPRHVRFVPIPEVGRSLDHLVGAGKYCRRNGEAERNLAQLPFSIIEKMLRVKRMDMIIHVSLQDLQRNLDKHSRVGGTLDIFAPGWRDAVDVNQATAALRAAFIEYWLGTIRSLGGTHPATGIPLIVGAKNQRLYWLVFLSSNSLGQKLWNDVQNLSGQGSLFEGL
jgi:hypothetical protein